jgi:hypothetical protein
MFEFSIPCVCFLLFVGLAVVAASISWYFSEQRRKALAEAAQLMGFDWLDKSPGLLTAPFRNFALFNRGGGADAFNVMRGQVGSREVLVMDYKYTTGSGKNRSTHTQTVVVFPQMASPLPKFELSPENFLSKIMQAFGYRDINFEEHPEFSRKYLLRGSDEEGIRAVFHQDLLDHFASHPGWSVESADGMLLVYRDSTTCDAKRLPEFIAECTRIAALFDEGKSGTGKVGSVQEEF